MNHNYQYFQKILDVSNRREAKSTDVNQTK